MFVIIIIVYNNNNDWRVKNVWNTEQLMNNKTVIQRELILQIGNEKIEKGTLSDLITATQSVPRVSKIINNFCTLYKCVHFRKQIFKKSYYQQERLTMIRKKQLRNLIQVII